MQLSYALGPRVFVEGPVFIHLLRHKGRIYEGRHQGIEELLHRGVHTSAAKVRRAARMLGLPGVSLGSRDGDGGLQPTHSLIKLQKA